MNSGFSNGILRKEKYPERGKKPILRVSLCFTENRTGFGHCISPSSLFLITPQPADPFYFPVSIFDLCAFVNAPFFFNVFFHFFPCFDRFVIPAHDFIRSCDADQRIVRPRAFLQIIGFLIEFNCLFIFADLPVETGNVKYGPLVVGI